MEAWFSPFTSCLTLRKLCSYLRVLLSKVCYRQILETQSLKHLYQTKGLHSYLILREAFEEVVGEGAQILNLASKCAGLRPPRAGCLLSKGKKSDTIEKRICINCFHLLLICG